MTTTPTLPTTVREVRPAEADAVTALIRHGYLGYAGELPPGLLTRWVEDVTAPTGAVVARTDPHEQESVILMPELDSVPDRGTS